MAGRPPHRLRPRAIHAPRLPLLLLAVGCLSAAVCVSAYDSIEIPIRPPNVPPIPRVTLLPNGSASVVIEPAQLSIALDAENQLNFTTPRYLTPGVARCFLQAPALVLGTLCTDFSIELNNQLPFQGFHTCPAAPAGPAEEFTNGPKDFPWSNLHTHGLKIDPGATNVSNICGPDFPANANFSAVPPPTPVEYYCDNGTSSQQLCHVIGDNVIVASRPLTAATPGADTPYVYGVRQHPGSTLRYTYPLRAVAPGVDWYHPHLHGSVGIQTPTANGPLIVPESTLPNRLWDLYTANGKGVKNRKKCDELIHLLDRFPLVDATILQLQAVWFRNASDGTPDDDSLPFLGLGPADRPDLSSRLLYSFDPATGTNTPRFTNKAGRDWLFVNGAFQPTLTLTAKKYARWEFLNTLTMKWLDLTFQKVNPDGSLTPADCTFRLLGRDGVPLPTLPRVLVSKPAYSTSALSDLILGPANRADVLVKCNAPGTYVLASAAGPFHTNYTACRATHCECFGDPPATTATLLPANNLYGGFELSAAVVAVVEVADLSAGIPADIDFRDDICRSRLELFSYLNYRKFPQPPVYQCVSFMNQMFGGFCSINNVLFPEAVTYVEQGTQQIWSIRDITFHPFHLHETQVRLKTLPRCVTSVTNNWRVGDWLDSILFPVCQTGCNWAENGSGGGIPGANVTVCDQTEIQWLATNFMNPTPPGAIELCDYLRPGSFPPAPSGMCVQRVSVYHCHVLPHEDEGCMSLLIWYCPGTTPTPPKQVCPSSYPAMPVG